MVRFRKLRTLRENISGQFRVQKQRKGREFDRKMEDLSLRLLFIIMAIFICIQHTWVLKSLLYLQKSAFSLSSLLYSSLSESALCVFDLVAVLGVGTWYVFTARKIEKQVDTDSAKRNQFLFKGRGHGAPQQYFS